MTRSVIVRSEPAQRHKPRDVGEMAGAAAADCAAVSCCCPCAVLNFVVLVVYTVPAGLLRKAVRRRRRRLLMKNGANSMKNDVVLLQPQMSSSAASIDITVDPVLLEEHLAKDRAAEEKFEAVALEKEMWSRFAGTGFWRSQSQREP